ncbi:hypothetical protein THASP1DRAFT_30065 [Thamnocephalis sphaerospora]|uniref:C2H2-type domain-containing protein n=1 Tax=Thamnocephalis sphaerospora TaxID=78915 RepID=A0A4P9XLD6_9FUNG|nr:hypothetical protein THASP1DRAFT_31566 [Thamnocephalis sphaerospora]RKP08130.1 hypothetical protein THASP1DRAFT_30065 [Thamnocephalis sphaerospora]|eukprot:RKP06625.1 hypothetical protein THASP1DRAFT_31566 [Thamnocephalis sphaerospora]
MDAHVLAVASAPVTRSPTFHAYTSPPATVSSMPSPSCDPSALLTGFVSASNSADNVLLSTAMVADSNVSRLVHLSASSLDASGNGMSTLAAKALPAYGSATHSPHPPPPSSSSHHHHHALPPPPPPPPSTGDRPLASTLAELATTQAIIANSMPHVSHGLPAHAQPGAYVTAVQTYPYADYASGSPLPSQPLLASNSEHDTMSRSTSSSLSMLPPATPASSMLPSAHSMAAAAAMAGGRTAPFASTDALPTPPHLQQQHQLHAQQMAAQHGLACKLEDGYENGLRVILGTATHDSLSQGGMSPPMLALHRNGQPQQPQPQHAHPSATYQPELPRSLPMDATNAAAAAAATAHMHAAVPPTSRDYFFGATTAHLAGGDASADKLSMVASQHVPHSLPAVHADMDAYGNEVHYAPVHDPRPTAGTNASNDELVAYRCQWRTCQLEFLDPAMLMHHVSEEHVGRRALGHLSLRCEWADCHVVARKRDHIISHVRLHVPYWPLVCPICNRRFKRNPALKRHFRRHMEKMQAP